MPFHIRHTSIRCTVHAWLPRMRQSTCRSPVLLPGAIVLLAIAAMLLHGPIAQLPDYHRFADQRSWLGIPNAADVLSNLGFGIVGLYGLRLLWKMRTHRDLRNSTSGYGLFFTGLLLTAFGSGWYHLAPDNSRLVFDRLPIALACGGLLAAVWQETVGSGRWLSPAMAVAAIGSVLWWRYTDLHRIGDLRPYLLLQLLPLILIPLLQYQARSPLTERGAYALAIGLYVLAKICELADHMVFDAFELISGHTLKHLLACLAAVVIARRLSCRLKSAARMDTQCVNAAYSS